MHYVTVNYYPADAIVFIVVPINCVYTVQSNPNRLWHLHLYNSTLFLYMVYHFTRANYGHFEFIEQYKIIKFTVVNIYIKNDQVEHIIRAYCHISPRRLTENGKKKNTIKPSLTSNPLDITLYYYFMTTKAVPQNNDRRSYRDGTPKILISHII